MRILVADDDPLALAVLSRVLEKHGYDVIKTVDGLDAWNVFQLPDPPQLAILDRMMPGLDGLDLVRRIRSRPTDRPPYLVMVTARDEAHISHGERLADCVDKLNAFPQIIAIGVNCTAPRYIPGLIAAIRESTDKPIVVYPNSGETYDAAHHAWCGPATDESFAQEAQRWFDAGARLIGGCCRTTPAHIAQIAAWARQLPG